MEENTFLKQGRIAQQQILEDGSLFPMVLLPPSPDENQSIGFFVNAIQQNREWIDKKLKGVGALLFRGFPVRSASDFNAVVEAFGWEEHPYLGLASRARVEGRVYTTNEAPLDQPIKFHHEMAMEDDPQSAIKGWQSAYGTNNKQEAEKKLSMSGVPVSKITWADDGKMFFEMGPIVSIRTVDPDTDKRRAWFNPSAIGHTTPMVGDGSLFPEGAMEQYIRIAEEECVDVTWEVGDVLVLDNRFLQHARRPSAPPRRVLAAFCK